MRHLWSPSGRPPHIPWTPKRWSWSSTPAKFQTHPGFPALPRGSGAEVSGGPRGSLIGWQHLPGRASGARRRGVKRRAGRSSTPSSWDQLRGDRNGVRLPQVYRLSGTGPETGIKGVPAPRTPLRASPQSSGGRVPRITCFCFCCLLPPFWSCLSRRGKPSRESSLRPRSVSQSEK